MDFHYGGMEVNVGKCYVHPDYLKYGTIDLCVLVLEHELEFNGAVGAIGIAENPEIEENTDVLIAGYGASNDKLKATADILRFGSAPCMSYERYKELFTDAGLGHKVHEKMFCAGVYDNPQSAALADAGGPVIIDDELVGIIGEINPNLPDIYVNVTKLADWIFNPQSAC